MNFFKLTFAANMILSSLSFGQSGPRQYICTIAEDEWCANIPAQAVSHVNRSGNACVFRFKITTQSNRADVDFVVRTADKMLNRRGEGPTFSASFKFKKLVHALPSNLAIYAPANDSMEIQLSDVDAKTKQRPFAFIKRASDLPGSYGNGFSCAEIDSKGNVRTDYAKGSAE